MRVVYWGTYDDGKPRNRILITGLKENGIEVRECHRNIWDGVEDKSQLKSWYKRLTIIFFWMLCYPKLIYQYLKEPSHDFVVVGYMGHFDVFVLWPFAKIKKVPIVWDVFISLYDTVVNDRKLISPSNPIAIILHRLEWLACKAADFVFLDTEAHAQFFRDEYRLNKQNCFSVFVGAETAQFPTVATENQYQGESQNISVLFYGQFIPLHGIETIIKAAAILKDDKRICWTIIGKGQVEGVITTMLEENPLPRLQWIKWVEYNRLHDFIHQADVCLGIFGTSEKASRVIPNKVFQIIACGKPLITRESEAIRELLTGDDEGVFLVPAGDENALADGIMRFIESRNDRSPKRYYIDKREQISPSGIGHQLLSKLQKRD